MSFWAHSSGPTLWHALLGAEAPTPLPCPDLPSRPPYDWQAEPTKDFAAVIQFLRRHYDKGASLDLSTEYIASYRSLLIVRNASRQIIGTIAAKPLGTWSRGEPFETIYIDLFCVHTEYRRAGVGRALLYGIYAATDPRAVFIKEGAALPLIVPPLRSSFYSWRSVYDDEVAPNCVRIWTFREFEAWAPASTLYNRPMATESVIFGYGRDAVAVFTPAHQRIGDEPLIWMTGYVEKGDVDRPTVMNALSVAAARHFTVRLVWVDGQYAPTWKKDGAYHIYAFNWDPGHYYSAEPVLFL